jgi:NAD+ synthase (glutamine-hydrolysing)
MSLRIALGQFNACVGDIKYNISQMRTMMEQASDHDVDVLVFPEMCVCGYPPEDLLFKKHFLTDIEKAIQDFAYESSKMTVIAGFPEINNNDKPFNSLAVLQDSKINHIYHKNALPNYGVFDEQRYFQAGKSSLCIQIASVDIALTICEDIWNLKCLANTMEDLPKQNIIINISASPFHVGKIDERIEILKKCAQHFNCALAYCNLIGGQDELVFDGRSMFLDPAGNVICQAKAFSEDLLIADVSYNENKQIQVKSIETGPAQSPGPKTDPISETYEALVLGTRDYIRKNGFEKVLIGLSGGIDSSLVAAIAAEALGPENVVGVTMPSRFNSPETRSDAERLAANLGIEFHTVPIGEILEQFSNNLSLIKGWDENGIAYENLQARIRGCILMSLSNQFSYLVLTTGNKSETAVGYCTLYGDTAGGFAVIKDVPKTMVYKLSEYINEMKKNPVIPPTVISRTPSAELKENQADTDSLPEYDLLDKILGAYIEDNMSLGEIVDTGLPEDVVLKTITMVDRNEYKRRLSPPGIKITPCSFGKDRRMPITNRYSP